MQGDHRKVAIQAIERSIFDGEPFTFSDLCAVAPSQHRLADQLIQKYRKRGLISFARIGRDSVWSLTDAGREEQKSRAATPSKEG